jgi:hypothetical protein
MAYVLPKVLSVVTKAAICIPVVVSLSELLPSASVAYIRSAKQDDNYGASNIILPCPGS